MQRLSWFMCFAWTLLGVAGCRHVPAELSVEQPPPVDRPARAQPLQPPPSWYGDLVLTPRTPTPTNRTPTAAAPADSAPSSGLTRIPTADLPPPSEAELRAWDRKDPEGEQQLYEWDKANLEHWSASWRELECMHLAVVSVGNTSINRDNPERWAQFVAIFTPKANAWIQRQLEDPSVLSKSKFVGSLLEAHELVVAGYPSGYSERDTIELEGMDALWVVISNKIQSYVERLGGELVPLDAQDPSAVADCRLLLDALDEEPSQARRAPPIPGGHDNNSGGRL